MKIEEAIEILEQRFDSSCRNNLFQNVEKLDYEDALWMAISALRSATREQVEKVCRGEWLNFYNDFSTAECSKCGELFEVSPDETPKEEFFKAFKEFYHFCPSCGAPMTDDANCTARVNFRRDSRRTIMKIEKVIKQLESILDHTRSMAASPDADEIWKEDSDALEFAITALRSMPEAGEPLSLKQLKQMDGKPVWVEFIGHPDGTPIEPLWMLVNCREKRLVTDVEYVDWNSEGWFAYSYPPAHIDRSKWTAKNVTDQHPVDQFICSECGTILEDFSLCKIDEDSGDKTYYEYELKFCPACGRAITEEAWAELERRLRMPEPPEEG